MTQTMSKREKRRFEVEHNGITYKLGEIIPAQAMRKAHHMVRDYLLDQWREKGRHAETTALVRSNGVQVGSVYGLHRNLNINIIHQ